MLAALSAPAAAQSQGSSSREVGRLNDAARGRLGTGPRPPTRAMVRRREPLPLRPPPTSGKLSPRRWECWESRRAEPPLPRRARTRLREATGGGRLTGRVWRPPRSGPQRGSAGRLSPLRTRSPGCPEPAICEPLSPPACRPPCWRQCCSEGAAAASWLLREGGPPVCWVVGDAGPDNN